MKKSDNIHYPLFINIAAGIAAGIIICLFVIWVWWTLGIKPFTESGRERGMVRIIASFVMFMMFNVAGVIAIKSVITQYQCKKIKLDIEEDLKDMTAVLTNRKIEAYQQRIDKLWKKSNLPTESKTQLCIASELLKSLGMMLEAQREFS